jgi:hypothetical protein
VSNFDEKDALARELRDRSHDVGGHPLDLGSVKRSAHRIQWRRRAAGTAVAAVVLAVAVPVGLTLTDSTNAGRPPVATGSPSATASASATDSASASSSPSPSATGTPKSNQGTSLVLADIAAGAAPRRAYLVTSSDGRTTTIHSQAGTDVLQGSYDDVTSYRGGWMAYGPGPNGPVISRFDATGAPMDQRPGTDFATSDDGTELAWVADGTLHSGLPSGHSEGELTQKLPAGATGTAVGFVQRGLVYSLDGTSPSVHITDLSGHDTVVPGLLKSWGVSQSADLVGGEYKYNSDGTSCWRVLPAGGGPELWHTCDWALGGFSPDGTYVVGTPSDGDGLGSTRIALLDAHTGKVVATFASPTDPQLLVRDFRWEDDSTLLAGAFSQGQWTVLRLRVDGSVERTLPLLPGTDTDAPYHLASLF